MDGLEKITARINADIDQEILRARSETQAQVDEILSQGRAQADKECAEILARGERAAQEREERLESAAQMETRKLKLAAKQEMLARAFDLALEKLCSLPEPEYVKLLTDLAVKASGRGGEKLVFSPKDRSRIGKQVVTGANQRLGRGGVSPADDPKVPAFLGKVLSSAPVSDAPEQLTLSEQTRPLRGGFIMLDGDVEINCAFETLIYMQREQLEREVARVLFETEV